MQAADTAATAPTRLRSNRLFIRFLAARGQSQVGSTLTEVTVPLLAAVVLDASATQIGLLLGLNAVLQLALRPVFAVLAENSADRGAAMRRVDVLRFALGLVVPVVWLAGLLTMPLLYVVAATSALLSALFGAYSAPYFTDIVRPEQFERAGGLLSTVTSVSDVAGPGLAALLMRVMPLPVVLLVDAASYLAGGLLVGRSPRTKPPPDERESRAAYALAGFRHVMRGPLAGATVGIAGLALLNAAVGANIPTFGTQTLNLSPSLIATAQAVGTVGAIAGSLIMVGVGARLPLTARAGAGLISMWVSLAALVGFAGAEPHAVLWLFGYELLGSLGAVVAMVSLITYIPRTVGAGTLARTMAAATLVPELGVVLGGPLGGTLGDRFGLHNLAVAACVLGVATTVVGVTLLRRVPHPPAGDD